MLPFPALSIIICGLLGAGAATLLAAWAARGRFPLPEGSARLGCVDGLRGYLALAVFVHHFSIWVSVSRFDGSWTVPPFSVLEGFGSGAVSLFFATTGLVFYPRVLSGLLATDWARVYISRIFRILPLTIASIALVLMFILANGLASDGLDPIALAQWTAGFDEPPLLGFLDAYRINAFVLWSLCFEWIFYVLILPLLAFAMDVMDVARLRRWSWLLPVAFLIAALAIQRMYLIGRLSLFLPMFAVGMIAYELRLREPVRRLLAHPGCTPFALASLAAALAIHATEPGFVAIGLYGFFFLCVACGNSLFGLLWTRGARVLGECSFSIYLMHGLVLASFFLAADRLSGAIDLAYLPLAAIPLAIVLAGVAMTSFYWIERPFIGFGVQVATWLHGRRGRLTVPERDVAP